MKRAISVILLAAMAVNLLTGCSGQQASSTPTPTPSSTPPAASSTADAVKDNANAFGWVVPEKTLVLNILNANGNYAPTEAEKQGTKNTAQYLKDEFNIELKVEQVTGDGKEAVNLALASNKYPDIITGLTYDMVNKFVQMKKAQELTPYMDTLGQDLKKEMGEMYPLFLSDDLKLYSVPSLMGAITELPDYSAHIRYDEWKAIGEPEIKTPDDYYNALNAILKATPNNANGEKRYAMSLYTEPNGQINPEDLVGYWGLQKGYKISEAGDFTNWAFTDEGKEMSKYINRFYKDGTLDPDSFINNFENWKTKFSNERIVGAIGGWWISSNAGHEVWQTIDPTIPEEKRYIQVSFKAPGAEAAYLSGKSEFGSRYTIITDKAKNVEELLGFINFQATEKGRALASWGIPNGTPIADTGTTGKLWDLAEDGTWSIDPAAKQALVTETWSYDNEYYWTTGIPMLFGTQNRWADGVHNRWPNQMWYEENKWKSLMIKNMDGTIFNASAMTLREKTEDITKIEQAIKDARLKDWPAVIQAKDDAAFDAAWANLQASLSAAGIEKYQTAMADNYKKNMAKLNS